jgi:hypothetical protein
MEWLFFSLLLPAFALAVVIALLFLRLVVWLIVLPFRILGALVMGLVLIALLPALFLAGLAVMGTLAVVGVGLLALPLVALAFMLAGAFFLARWLIGARSTAGS